MKSYGFIILWLLFVCYFSPIVTFIYVTNAVKNAVGHDD
jgi:hypothetical protein